ncbi:MAG: hypothetical protein Q8O67_02540 [Deltaproteobacteria bacterium]|nr:hypothetical protein [Deltaproteobacteria bacterium]
MVAAVAQRFAPPQEALVFPPLALRQQAVVDLVGADALEPSTASFRRILTAEVRRLFDHGVLPRVRPVWSDVDVAPFVSKWRGGFDLYCSLALSSIVCSARRPVTISIASKVFRALGVDEEGIAAVGLRVVPFVFRVLERRACQRAALVSAWILVLDEALDEGLNNVPLGQRPRVLADTMRGALPEGATPELRAVHVLGAAIRDSVRDAADKAHLARVVDDVEAWACGEVKNLLGEPDPAGVAHRTIGITASMDLLGWAVSNYAAGVEHQFLYRVAELGQMVDDWLDLDKDHAQGRVTPATIGVWNPETMSASYVAAEALLHQLADEVGEPQGAYRRLLVRTFRGQVQHMVRCLVDNP